MPAQPAKQRNRHFTQVGVETAYADHGSTAYATADTSFSFHTRAQPTVTPGYQFDGALEGEGSPGGNSRPNIATQGRWAAVELPFYFRSPTATYSSSVIPDALRACRGHGLSASFSTGTWTLAPQRSAHTSVGVDVYADAEREILCGVFFQKLAIAYQAGRVPEWTLSGQGVRAIPTDTAVPTLGYQAFSRDYATYVNTGSGSTPLSLTVGGNSCTMLIREGTFTSERPIEERMSGQESGESGLAHPGFVLGNEVATFEGIVEAASRVTTTPFASGANISPTHIYEAGNAFTVNIQSGRMTSQHGFRIASAASSACFEGDVERDGSGAAALWKIKIRFNASTDVANDAYSITAT